MKDNITRFAVSAVAVVAILFLCVTTYGSIQNSDEQAAYTQQTEASQETSETTTVSETTTTTTTVTTAAAQTQTQAANNNKNNNTQRTTTTTAAKAVQPAATTTTAAQTTTTITTAQTTTATTAAQMSASQYASAMFDKVNSYRTSNGRSSLQRVTSGALYNAAMKRLEEIMVSYSHTRPDGSDDSTVYAQFGLYPSYTGENLGRGSLDGVFDLWIGSSGHKSTILSGNYTQTAIVCGYANGRRHWVQLFIG